MDLTYVGALLGWDQQTYMPPGGAEGRGNQLALLGRLIHERATSPELGKLLEDLKPYAASLDPDSDDARLVKVTARTYRKSRAGADQARGRFCTGHHPRSTSLDGSARQIGFFHLPPAPGEDRCPAPGIRLVLPEFRASLRCPAGRFRTEHEDRGREGHLRRAAPEAGGTHQGHQRASRRWTIPSCTSRSTRKNSGISASK